MEILVAVPLQFLLSLIALLYKTAFDDCPIGLMPLPYRIWVALQWSEFTGWEEGLNAHWDTAIKGSIALRSALMRMLPDEVGKWTESHAIHIFWDM